MSEPFATKPRVALFATCLVDVFRPSVGFAAARLIEASGCSVEVPVEQTCCGQPAYNSGARDEARTIALATMRAFSGYDYVVAPSGSCAAMLKAHYPRLFAGEGALEAEAIAFAGRVHELVSFLVNVRRMRKVASRCSAKATYHDSCSGLRELGISREPRVLLSTVEGLTLAEMRDSQSCCGFGGLFAVKHAEISTAIVDRKLSAAEAVSPDLLLAGDLGCLMHIAGRLKREGSAIACRHVAEVLAEELDDPPIAMTDGDP